MTTLVEARESVYSRFSSLWTFTPFIFENVDTDLDTGEVDWARLSVNELGGGQETLGPTGNRKYRRVFSAFVQIYTQTNKGMKRAAQLGEEVRTIFEGVSFSELDFNNVLVTDLGPDDKWQQTLAEADGRYTEIK